MKSCINHVCGISLFVGFIFCAIQGAFAALGNCSQATVQEKNHRCLDTQYCVPTGNGCVPLTPVVTCANGLTANSARWNSLTSVGSCQSTQYITMCHRCPGTIECAIGNGWQDSNCMFFACVVFNNWGPNGCAVT